MAALDAALIAAATAAASLSSQIRLGAALASIAAVAPLGLRVEAVNLLTIATLTGSLSTVSRFSAAVSNSATLTAALTPGVAALASALTAASTLTMTPSFGIALAANLQASATLIPGFSLGSAALAAILVNTVSVGIDFVAIFTFVPDQGVPKKVKSNTKQLKFGDGYQLDVGLGVTVLSESWSLTFAGRTLAELQPIDAFLKARKGARYFYWYTPNGKKKSFRCPVWNLQYFSDTECTLSCQFEQVFEG